MGKCGRSTPECDWRRRILQACQSLETSCVDSASPTQPVQRGAPPPTAIRAPLFFLFLAHPEAPMHHPAFFSLQSPSPGSSLANSISTTTTIQQNKDDTSHDTFFFCCRCFSNLQLVGVACKHTTTFRKPTSNGAVFQPVTTSTNCHHTYYTCMTLIADRPPETLFALLTAFCRGFLSLLTTP